MRDMCAVQATASECVRALQLNMSMRLFLTSLSPRRIIAYRYNIISAILIYNGFEYFAHMLTHTFTGNLYFIYMLYSVSVLEFR